ncbi:hypothetical protein ACHAXA_008489 [Cyclostephanos tholiformis]|uniref:Nicotinamidase n=1 Tax=Cyclostephanos tholiformis TaxID=382380 RepID=A0ABD3RJM3_9STRA
MTTLLIIDCQRDFHPGGSLAIPNADSDALRISKLIKTHGGSIDRIIATLDSHHPLHIAHPGFWRHSITNDGPSPFTMISSGDIENGTWIPRGDVKSGGGRYPYPILEGYENADLHRAFDVGAYCIEYARRLEMGGRFRLCIWPEHCLIGSSGHGIVDVVFDAMNAWCRDTGGIIEYVYKGMNPWTEMYSALCAEVPVGIDTGFNRDLLESLKDGTDRLVVCGQALSHCVNYTVRDIVDNWPKDERSKIVILKDCASSVPGFEGAGEIFLTDMENAGVRVGTSDALFRAE